MMKLSNAPQIIAHAKCGISFSSGWTATRLFENDEGEYWYEVMFEDSFAYLPADATNEYMPQGLLDILSPPPAEKNE